MERAAFSRNQLVLMENVQSEDCQEEYFSLGGDESPCRVKGRSGRGIKDLPVTGLTCDEGNEILPCVVRQQHLIGRERRNT